MAYESLTQYEEAIFQAFWDALNGQTFQYRGNPESINLFRSREEEIETPAVAAFVTQQEPLGPRNHDCDDGLYVTTITVECIGDEKGLVNQLRDVVLETPILSKTKINLTDSQGNNDEVRRHGQPRILHRFDREQEKHMQRLQQQYLHYFGVT